MGTSALPFASNQLPKTPSLLRASGLTSSPACPSQGSCAASCARCMHGKVCTLSDCCPVCSAPGNAQGSFLFFLKFITYGVLPLGSVLMADHAIYPVSLGTGSQGTFCGSPEYQRAGPHSCHVIEEGVVVALRSGQAGFLREGRLIWALTQISNSISDGPSHSTSALVPGAQDCVLPADTVSMWNRSPVSESPDISASLGSSGPASLTACLLASGRQ